MKKSQDYIDQVIKNINEDREITRDLLDDAIKYLAKDESRHRDIGIVMAKYVETLQRSNEQLVKIVNIMSKKETSQDLTMGEMENIYEMIKGDDDEHKE
jgi:Ni,Fe-hydrogenase I large subunit